MAYAPIFIEAPTVRPAPFGLLDTVGIAGTNPRAGLGVEFEPEFCGTARETPVACEAAVAKTADDGKATVVGEPIAIYHIFQCRAIGSWDDAQGRARKALDLGASRAVEAAFQTVISTGADDVTPSGTAVDPVLGLGLLEQHAGENYGGVPVIHMTRTMATILLSRQAIFRVGDHLETGLGSLVVAGAGYDGTAGPSAPAVGAEWMIATGNVAIWQGSETFSEPLLDNPYTNQFKALAERTYVPTFECFNAGVEVTQSACCA